MPSPIEFETELTGSPVLTLPPAIASALPSQGRATVVVFLNRDPDDDAWQQMAYERFLVDDAEEDAVYDRYG